MPASRFALKCLRGGQGNDTLDGGVGKDTLDGGSGQDRAKFADNLGDYQLEKLANGDTLVTSNGSRGSTTVANVEEFMFADKTLSQADVDAHIEAETDVPDEAPDPAAGSEVLAGSSNNDTIRALEGDDTVNGMAGDDLLLGGAGNDVLKGAGGNDRLRGNGGDDTLKGNGGDDNLKGGGGSDVINGGGGADRLNGGGGDDVLIGKRGDDTLKGNGGADVFQFRASDRNDTVLDFRQGQDKIEIISGANSFAALQIDQDGADVLIGFGAGQVRIVTDRVAAFEESDFVF